MARLNDYNEILRGCIQDFSLHDHALLHYVQDLRLRQDMKVEELVQYCFRAGFNEAIDREKPRHPRLVAMDEETDLDSDGDDISDLKGTSKRKAAAIQGDQEDTDEGLESKTAKKRKTAATSTRTVAVAQIIANTHEALNMLSRKRKPTVLDDDEAEENKPHEFDLAKAEAAARQASQRLPAARPQKRRAGGSNSARRASESPAPHQHKGCKSDSTRRRAVNSRVNTNDDEGGSTATLRRDYGLTTVHVTKSELMAIRPYCLYVTPSLIGKHDDTHHHGKFTKPELLRLKAHRDSVGYTVHNRPFKIPTRERQKDQAAWDAAYSINGPAWEALMAEYIAEFKACIKNGTKSLPKEYEFFDHSLCERNLFLGRDAQMEFGTEDYS
ncbi:unnamed protein product [Diplocarpon coronariae]|nr:hypothetical protein JHW43_005231 [Diplocarpon mali]